MKETKNQLVKFKEVPMLSVYKADAIRPETLDEARATLNAFNTNESLSAKARAFVIYEVMVKSLYKVEGFETCAEWAEKEFGIKKSRVSQMLTTAKHFLKNGAISIFANEYGDFSESQLFELRPREDKKTKRKWTIEDALKAVESGEINFTTSQKDIRAYVDAKLRDIIEDNTPLDESETTDNEKSWTFSRSIFGNLSSPDEIEFDEIATTESDNTKYSFGIKDNVAVVNIYVKE